MPLVQGVMMLSCVEFEFSSCAQSWVIFSTATALLSNVESLVGLGHLEVLT